MKAAADRHERRGGSRCVQVAVNEEVDYGLVRDPDPTCLQELASAALSRLPTPLVAGCVEVGAHGAGSVRCSIRSVLQRT